MRTFPQLSILALSAFIAAGAQAQATAQPNPAAAMLPVAYGAPALSIR